LNSDKTNKEGYYQVAQNLGVADGGWTRNILFHRQGTYCLQHPLFPQGLHTKIGKATQIG